MKKLHTAGMGLWVAVVIFLGIATAWAGIPEPDVVYYGGATHRGGLEPATEEISLVLNASSLSVASYVPGSVEAYGESYVLRVPMDALASIEGQAASFYIGGRLAGTTHIPAKGSVVQLDLDTLTSNDSEPDGMDDSWEMQHFGTLGRDGLGDINGNGFTDKQEYENGTDPTAPVWSQAGNTLETCIFHPLVLQKALTEAQDDDNHNRINLQTGAYVGNFSYTAIWGEDYDLEIVGGYDPDCQAPEGGTALTVLDGNGDGPVLILDTATDQTGGHIRVENLYITNGSALEGGGIAVVTDTGDVTLLNNIITGNTATDVGGGISLRALGAVQTLAVVNNTIDDNEGGGIYCSSTDTSPVIMNNIITSNASGEGLRADGAPPDSDYNNLWNNEGGGYNDPAFQGDHDISVNPHFGLAGDFGLQPDSACIDAGRNEYWLPDFDIQGNARIMDGDAEGTYRVDMGAYEYAGTAPPGGCDPVIDDDCDGNIDQQPPGVPNLIAPLHDSRVGTATPELAVGNATDDDSEPPIYEFQLYIYDQAQDVFVFVTSSGDVAEGSGTTSWLVNTTLAENTLYRWRVRAKDDDFQMGAWSNFFTFFVNTANEAPNPPSLNSPLEGEEVQTPQPTLVVGNATDADQDVLTYQFEIDEVDTFDIPVVEQSGDIPEGAAGTTSWTPTFLDENTPYYWRARACDTDRCGDWMTTASLLVNSVNDPPTIPQISAPPDGSEVAAFQPELEVSNAGDADGDPLTYEFQLFADTAMTTRITSATGVAEEWDGSTAWQVDDMLQNNRSYWWRVQARDDKGKASGWSALFSFTVDTTNTPPSAPAILTPFDGMVIQTLEPSLVIGNAVDDNLDPIFYYFDIDRVNTFNSTALQRSARLPEGVGGITAWRPASPLTDGMTYFWRVIAYDGETYSSWTTGSFAVNLANDLPTAPSLSAPQNGAEVSVLTPVLEVGNAADLDADPLVYRFDVDAVASFDSPALQQSGDIPEGAGNTTSWTPASSLEENSLYYWRARACDGPDGQGCGAWMTTAGFRVNTVNDLPSSPGISAPPEGAVVTVLQPVLEVTNAADADGDALTYEFEVYSQAQTALITAVAGIPQEADGTTAWQVDVPLDDGAACWWRARAEDGKGGRSGWSPWSGFEVSTTNAAPSSPAVVTPPDGSQVPTLTPSLVVANATDANLDAITYYFEIDTVSTFNSAARQRSAWISEGVGGITSWNPPLPLTDNTTYHWRVVAYDGASYSQWTNGTFFVNFANDLPTVPSLNSPPDQAQVQSPLPTLAVDNAADPDRDALIYRFEVDLLDTFDSGANQNPLVESPDIPAGAGGITSWTLSAELDDNTTYHWRARACDDHGCGPDMPTASFMVNSVNDAPSIPQISEPPEGSELASLQPLLVVTNAADADGDPLTYEFQLYADAAMTILVTSAFGIPEQWDTTTAWQVDKVLQNNRSFWWRAQARDSKGQAGGWSPLFSFTVNTANTPPTAPIIVTPLDGAQVPAREPSLVINNATDEDLDPVTYYFDVDRVATFDSPALQRSARIEQGALGITAWRPPLPLTDGVTYYWRVIAYDGASYSGWTIRSFTVNLANNPPSVPVIIAPEAGEEVKTLTPALVIENSTDADLDPITYYFEIDTKNTYDSTFRRQSPGVAQGADDVTSWRPGAPLADNTTYHWRVIACDGASYSDWAAGSFFVNRANDPPGTPTIESPGDGDDVAALSPVLRVNAATDPDGDDLTYDYEVYADPDGTRLVRSIEGAGPAWPVDAGLADNTFYWWRFRARDDEGAPSAWSALFVFFVNTVNDAPSAPSINRPQYGREVTTRLPVLEVNNGADVDRDALTYEFEIDTAGTFSSEALQFDEIDQGGTHTTAWRPPYQLVDHMTYYWRARACDAESCSEWMPRAEFFVNTFNETPVIPNLSAPPDGSEVTTTRPTLEVTNATNPDRDLLTYEFEVYDDAAGHHRIAFKTNVLEEDDGTTSWRVNKGIKKHGTYWWRVQARDDEGEPSGWSDLFSFKVDTKNDAPAVPSIVTPPPAGEVPTLEPVLAVTNAVDENRDELTYWFEIDKKNTFDSLALQQSVEIMEGAGPTTAWYPSALEDDTLYYWRSRAFDGEAYSNWVTSSFFVNQTNDQPAAPTVQNPDESTVLTVSAPVLSVYPQTDPELDGITYDYEVYSDADLTDLVSEAEGQDAFWQMDVDLVDQVPYYWQARAVDEHGLAGDWSLLASFSVNTRNIRPTAPTLNNPFNLGFVTTLRPVLSVNNAVDPDDTQLTYEFELYADRSLSEPVASARLSEGNLITSWPLEMQLTDETTYYWRVRAHDGQLPGSWMNTAIFMVNTEAPETRVVLACAQEVEASESSTQTVEVTRRGSPLEGVALEIPPGALQEDCTITIGMVENPPALPENTRAINRVLDFGPDGSKFEVPLTVRIPYTWEDLKNSGVSDPALLEIWTFNPVTLAWEAIPVDRVEGWDLIYQVDHFSIFATGRSVPSVTAGVDAPGTGSTPAGSGGGGGGGACFVACAANGVSMGFGSGLLLLLLFSVLPVMLSRNRKNLTTKNP